MFVMTRYDVNIQRHNCSADLKKMVLHQFDAFGLHKTA